MNPKLIEKLIDENKLDIRPIVAITLRACGLTLREVGEILGISKQGVDLMIKRYNEKGQL